MGDISTDPQPRFEELLAQARAGSHEAMPLNGSCDTAPDGARSDGCAERSAIPTFVRSPICNPSRTSANSRGIRSKSLDVGF